VALKEERKFIQQFYFPISTLIWAILYCIDDATKQVTQKNTFKEIAFKNLNVQGEGSANFRE
jgi:hypothetical protein